MKFQISALVAAAAFAVLSTSAMAGEPVTAKLQAPIEGVKKIAAGGAVFTCIGDTCAASTTTGETNTVTACRALVRKAGAAAAFGTASNPLAEDRLARCNEAAKR